MNMGFNYYFFFASLFGIFPAVWLHDFIDLLQVLWDPLYGVMVTE